MEPKDLIMLQRMRVKTRNTQFNNLQRIVSITAFNLDSNTSYVTFLSVFLTPHL